MATAPTQGLFDCTAQLVAWRQHTHGPAGPCLPLCKRRALGPGGSWIVGEGGRLGSESQDMGVTRRSWVLAQP